MIQPETRYAKSDDIHIAYQVFGDAPRDLILNHGFVSNIEVFWEEASCARFLERLATFARVIVFDKRGTGLSDRVPIVELPTLEQRIDDVRAVMGAVGSERAALYGYSEGSPMCARFAATYPARTSALIMEGTYGRRRWALDYPWGLSDDQAEMLLDAIRTGWVWTWCGKNINPKPHSTRSNVASGKSSRSASMTRTGVPSPRRSASSCTVHPTGLTSMCTRFLAVLASGTRRKVNVGPAPDGSAITMTSSD
jgi:pimeloyl-ACP methyl ester carboxylesterase